MSNKEMQGYVAAPTPARSEGPEGIVKEKPFENEFNVSVMLQTAGSVELSKEQKDILYASVKEDDVEIRPDGIIYLPWMEYARRLTEAFGMGWALIPQGMPRFLSKRNAIYWGFWLVIHKSLCGYAIGEQEYFPESKKGKSFMTYSDACEGAKSNALMRLCKGIGISLELWKPSFVREWRKKHAERYYDQRTDKNLWRRKGSASRESEEADSVPKTSNTPSGDTSDNLTQRLFAMLDSEFFSKEEAMKIRQEMIKAGSLKEKQELFDKYQTILKERLPKSTQEEQPENEQGELY